MTRDTPSLATRIQLTLSASKLPKGGTLRNIPPDTFARVSRLPPGPPGPPGTVPQIQHVGATELISKSCSPRWATVLVLDYEWGTEMPLHVEICAKKRTSGMGSTAEGGAAFQSLGGAVLQVSDILGTKRKAKAKRLPKGGCVYAHLEQRRRQDANEDQDYGSLALELGALRLDYKKTHLQRVLALASNAERTTFFEILRQTEAASGSLWNVVYRSLPEQETSKPKWDRAEIDLELLCNGDVDRALQVRVYCQQRKVGSGGHHAVEIGRLETNVRTLLKKGQCGAHRDWHQATFSLCRQDENVGTIAVHEAVILQHHSGTEPEAFPSRLLPVPSPSPQDGREEEDGHPSDDTCCDDNDDEESTARLSMFSIGQIPPHHTEKPPPGAPPITFASYIEAGCSVELCVAIDFTSSNGDPRLPGTLHYHSEATLNDYEEAIHTVAGSVAPYSRLQQFPVWGFGAKFGGQVRHIFQCGTRRTVPTVHDIYVAYRSVFASDLIMSGPTVLVDVIKAAAARAKPSHANIRSERKYTVLLVLTDGIVSDLESTKETLFHVSELPLSVVVVGIGRADFSEMDHVTQPYHANQRRNSTWVAFRDHQHDPRSLSLAALAAVPTQMVDYFLRQEVLPWSLG